MMKTPTISRIINVKGGTDARVPTKKKEETSRLWDLWQVIEEEGGEVPENAQNH